MEDDFKKRLPLEASFPSILFSEQEAASTLRQSETGRVYSPSVGDSLIGLDGTEPLARFKMAALTSADMKSKYPQNTSDLLT